MNPFAPTDRTTLSRLPSRASYDRPTIERILDEGLVCHAGFVVDGQPYVIPTTYARVGSVLYIHGSSASRMLRTLRGGARVCVTVTHLDGLVLARSAFHHSMNYRSVVILGTATEVVDAEEKEKALGALVEHVLPGRSADVRAPSAQELKATMVLSLPLEEVSAKIRTGPPKDDEEDYQLACWAGEIPLRLTALPPADDGRVPPGVAVPASATAYDRARLVRGPA